MKFLPLLLLATPVFAGEYAVLRSGFRIHALRHEIAGAVTRVHTVSGTLEFPSTEVSGFELEEYTPPPPAPPKSPEPVASVAPKPLPAPTPQELLARAAQKHGLRPEFVASVAKAESALRADALSPKGAIGLMQLMPGTAQELGVDPRDPAQNAEGGTRYLKQLLLKYKDSSDPVRMALAAYNAGPAAVDKYRTIPPYAETQVYVERVLRKYLAELQPTAR